MLLILIKKYGIRLSNPEPARTNKMTVKTDANTLRWAVVLLIPVLLSLAVPSLAEEPQSAEIVDRIVAKVNDEIILLSELNNALEAYADNVEAYNFSDDKKQEMLFKLREDVLNQLVEKKLTQQQINTLGIGVDEAEIDSAVERIKTNNFLTDETMRATLADKGMTMAEYRNSLKEQILRARLIDYKVKSNIIITKEDVETYYNEHAQDYAGTARYHLRNIIMKMPESSYEKQDVLVKMQAIQSRLKQGEPFASLAMIYSESPIADNGGDIGLFKLNELDPKIKTAVEKINPGEFTDIIDTDLGYQIFYLEEIVTTEGISLEEATPAIEEKLYKQELNKRFKAWLAELKEEAHIQLIR